MEKTYFTHIRMAKAYHEELKKRILGEYKKNTKLDIKKEKKGGKKDSNK